MTRTPTEVLTGAATADVWPPVMAVDPGKSVGLVLRAGRMALIGTSYVMDPDIKPSDHDGLLRHAQEALRVADEMIAQMAPAMTRMAEKRDVEPGGLRWAVETLVAPSPYRTKDNRISFKASDFATLGPAAVTLGLVVGRHPDALLVPPAGRTGHTTAKGTPLTGWDNLGPASKVGPYHPSVVGPAPEGWPAGGERKHQRAAWAIAGAAHLLYPASREGQRAVRVPEEAAQQPPEPDRSAEVAVVRLLLEQSAQWTSHWHKPRVLVRVARAAAETLSVELPESRIPAVVRALARGARREDGDLLRDRVRAVLEKDAVA